MFQEFLSRIHLYFPYMSPNLKRMVNWGGSLLLLFPLLFWLGCGTESGKQRGVFNVSYDPTRELYSEYNEDFAIYWKEKTGETILVERSNGGSRAQSRAVQSGMEADVVTLAVAMDIDEIAKSRGKFLPLDWQSRLPHNSCPYTSTIVLLVRKGNPKQIKGWEDLTQEGLKIITPNPKTSGGACWNYLAIWGCALEKELAPSGGLVILKDSSKGKEIEEAQKKAYEFTKKIYANARSQGMPGGAREATDDFVKRGNGDVFLAWENEAILSQLVKKEEGFEIITPSSSILAEPPVAIVDAVVERHGNRDIAEEYLRHLYDPESQELIARHHYRPSNPEVAAKHHEKYPELQLFTIDDVFGGWETAQKVHFNANGMFDKMITELSNKR